MTKEATKKVDKEKKMSKFHVGQQAEDTMHITERAIYDAADFSGNYSPVHISKAYAADTRFKVPIAHSLLSEALISRVIGMQLPGTGAVFIKAKFVYLKPVVANDYIKAVATVEAIDVEKETLDINVKCINQNGEVVLDCDTRVLYLGSGEQEEDI